MKVCENQRCGTEFEPVIHKQRFCCPSCRNRVAHQRLKTPEHQRKQRAWALKSRANHPQTGYRAAAKRYLSGRLPAWMYT